MKFLDIHSALLIRFLYGCVIVFLLFFIAQNFLVTKDIQEAEKIAIATESTKTLDYQEEVDTDGDGLLDWEEVLYGTDTEKADTDDDGMSDRDEIKNNRSPLVFGVGDKNQIDIVTATQKNVLSLQEQKSFFNQEYQQRQAQEEKIKKVLSQQEKTPEQLAYLSAEREKKEHIFIDINSAGLVVKNNSFDISSTYVPFEKLFLFFFPDNSEKIKKFIADGGQAPADMQTYTPLSAVDKQYIQTFITKYTNIGKGLKGLSIDDFALQKMIHNLAENYLDMSESIDQMSTLAEQGDRNIDIVTLMNTYANASILSTKNRKYINDFLILNKIELTEAHPGFFFVFSF